MQPVSPFSFSGYSFSPSETSGHPSSNSNNNNTEMKDCEGQEIIDGKFPTLQEQLEDKQKQLERVQKELEKTQKLLQGTLEQLSSQAKATESFSTNNALLVYCPSLASYDPTVMCSIECEHQGVKKVFKVSKECLKHAFGIYKQIFREGCQLEEAKNNYMVWQSSNRKAYVKAVAHVLFFATALSHEFDSSTGYIPLYKMPEAEAEEILEDVLTLSHYYEVNSKLEEECVIYIQQRIKENPALLSYYFNFAFSDFRLVRKAWLEIISSSIDFCKKLAGDKLNCDLSEKQKHLDILNGLFDLVEFLPVENLQKLKSAAGDLLSCLDDKNKSVNASRSLDSFSYGVINSKLDKPFIERLSQFIVKLARLDPLFFFFNMRALKTDLIESIFHLKVDTLPARYIPVSGPRHRYNNNNTSEIDTGINSGDIPLLEAMNGESQGQDSWVMSLLGIHYLSTDKDKAFSYLQQAVNLDSSNALALYFLGQYYANQSNDELSLHYYNLALNNTADRATVLKARAQLYQRQAKYTAARNDYSQVLEIHPQDLECLVQLIQIHFFQSNYSLAVKIVQKLEKDLMNNTLIANKIYHFFQENYLAITQNLNIISYTFPSFNVSYDNYKLASYNLPSFIVIYAFIHIGNYEKAREVITRALENNPLNSVFLAARGACDCMQGNYQEALQNLNQAIEIDSCTLFALAYRAYVYGLMNDYEAAFKDLEVALKINKDDLFSLTVRAYLLGLAGSYDESFSLFEKITHNHSRAFILARQGDIYRRQGDYEKARENLTKASKISSLDAFTIKALEELDKEEASLEPKSKKQKQE